MDDIKIEVEMFKPDVDIVDFAPVNMSLFVRDAASFMNSNLQFWGRSL